MSAEETVKLRVSVSLSHSVSSHKEAVIDTGETREDWDEMSPESRESLGNELYEQWVAERLGGGWEVIDS